MYETTDLRQAIECKVLVSPARAYARATPAQRRGWFPDGPPAGASSAPAGCGAGASWDAAQDLAALAKATRAGMAALTAGYGPRSGPTGASPASTARSAMPGPSPAAPRPWPRPRPGCTPARPSTPTGSGPRPRWPS
jgi:hypothetical protein